MRRQMPPGVRTRVFEIAAARNPVTRQILILLPGMELPLPPGGPFQDGAQLGGVVTAPSTF